MKLKKILRSALLFTLVVAMLGVVPAFAAEGDLQADYELNVSARAIDQGDVLTISANGKEYSYAVSTATVSGLNVSDSRSYAGDYAAVAGVEGMMLTLTDPACKGIVAEGSWKDSVDAADVTVRFNGEEQDFSGDSLELECETGKLTVNKDGSIRFAANADSAHVTISQSCGEESCSVSLQRRNRALPKDSSANIALSEAKMDDWVGVPLPVNMKAIRESLSWNQYLQFSVANDNLYCRQVEAFPFSATYPTGNSKHVFTIRQSGGLTACGNWSGDIGKRDKRIVRFNGVGHAYDTSDTVNDGVFMLKYDRWLYTADDCGAGAFQFTSQQGGALLQAAVGRGDVPVLAAAGGETLTIESNGKTFTHTMQRLTREEGNAPLESKLTVYATIKP